MIPFAAWLPDQYLLNNPQAAGAATGVLPASNSYLPWPSLVQFSLALGSACLGAVTVRTNAGSYTVFAGTRTKLYKYVGPADAWTDVTRSSGGDYDVPTDELWSFAQYSNTAGNYLVACNANTGPQVIDIEAGTNFALLSADAPAARFCRTVGSFLFLYGLVDYPNTIRWSGRGDHTWWTVNQRDAGDQTFIDGGGLVTGCTNLETGMIFQEGAIRRFAPTNDRAIFNFARIVDQRGLIAPASMVTIGGRSYYLGRDGFRMADGLGNSQAIGADAIDKWFQSDCNFNRLYAVQGVADPVRARVYWLYPAAGNESAVLDHCLCYDIQLNRWTFAEVSASVLFAASTPGYTIDTIDDLLDALGYTLETVPFSFDAKWLAGGAPYLAAFDGSYKMALFSGTPMAATVETADFQPLQGRRAFVQGVRLLTDAANATTKIGVKERPQSSLSYGGASSINAQGVSPHRASGRFIRVRAQIAAGEDWQHLQGIDFDPEHVVQDGER